MNKHACHKLIGDIVYHAIKDAEALQNSRRAYADDDHRAMCNAMGYRTGREELEDFFSSPWFFRICDEFQDVSSDDILECVAFT